jgi:hypothetical protein
VHTALPDDLSDYVIELTEHELFSAEERFDERLQELRARGARVALDDAGAGYAGLQQLIRVAPDILKLDRSLVRGAHADASRLSLLTALASFATDTGAAVCGEGIEELADLEVLADLDATYAQGYALARPGDAWPALLPGASANTSARVVHGVRVTEESRYGGGAWARGLAALADDLLHVRDPEELIYAGRRAAWLLDADIASLMLVDDDMLLQISDEEQGQGRRWHLDEYPATRELLDARVPGQIVVGDAASDPDEVAELQRLGYNTLLMVPMAVGGGRRALMEVYRRYSQAFTSAEVDRARVVALQFAAVLGRLYS